MSNSTYDSADPRLTAYVLGELEDAERQAVESQLEQCAESRTAVEEIRETVGLVTSALAAEPAESLTAEQRTLITDEAASPATAQTVRRSTWRGRAASFTAGVAATSVVILLVVPQLHRVVDRESRQMNRMNGENAIIATTSGSSKYGQDEFGYVVETGSLDGMGAHGPSLDMAGEVGQSLGDQRRWDGQQQELHAATELTERATVTRYEAEVGMRSVRGEENVVSNGDLTPRPTQLMLAGEATRATIPTKVKRSQIERLPQGQAPGESFFERPNSRASTDQESYSANATIAGLAPPVVTTEPNRPSRKVTINYSLVDRAKTRIAGTSRFGVPAGGEKGQKVPLGWRQARLDWDDGALGLGPNSDAGVVGSVVMEEGSANEQYLPIIENPFLSPNNDPLSTFSIDVDTASYSNVRRFLKHGQFPPANAVRIEELVNYFHYDYPEPADGQPFSVNLEAGPCPWNSEHRLVRVGLKGKDIDKSQRPPSNLVFLLDVSGSMRDANKLPLVKTAMEMLVGEMTEDDRIAIVTYSGQAGLKLPSTSGQDKKRIIDAIHALSAGGSTNGEAGIKLAYEQAVGNFIEDGTNRVILCTDGDFNVGTSGNAELVTLIQEKAKSNVFLSVFGFGMGNLKDGKLEQIADKGNGHYGYIDDEQEARKVFVEEAVGTLYTIAKDVKIQVEFNPQQVGGYRLIGYENRMLAAKDFNDDTKDAGEIGAGHTVTALYEVVPIEKLPAKKSVDKLKYQKPVQVNDDDKVAQELLTVKLRYKQPKENKSTKIDFTLTDNKPRNEMPSVDFEWAASCAGFGLLLRNSQYRGQADFDLIRELAMGSRGDDESGRRREFLDLVYTAHALRARQLGQPIPPRESLPEDKAREVAAVGGKYEKLLKRIEAPNDEAAYGPLTDFGYWAGKSWAGHADLPKGHWVYVAPHWYIWGNSTVKQLAKPEKK